MDYDLVVIGAGIQGTGVAQAASALGYRVLVIEQFSLPALGTSSRSSKLIHGGLRYLETGQFTLVRECLIERALLLKNAPHLVKLIPFYIPVYKDSIRSPFKVAIGLSIYALFSRKLFHRIPPQEWSSLDGLNKQDLKAVFKYYDAQTDDAKLTAAVLASAQAMGAEVRYNTTFVTATIEADHCATQLITHGVEQTLTSHAIVNASGPWVSDIASKVSSMDDQPKIELVQGTHIEVPGSLDKGIYYLEAPQDKRAVFVMPWKEHLLIGTTETVFAGNPANVVPLANEVEYLLNVYNYYFSASLTKEDIINSFAGLRVLPKSSGSAFSRPRDTLIVGNTSKVPRLLTLYGGKLTAYRATSEHVLNKLRSVLPDTTSVIDTKTLKLPLIY